MAQIPLVTPILEKFLSFFSRCLVTGAGAVEVVDYVTALACLGTGEYKCIMGFCFLNQHNNIDPQL